MKKITFNIYNEREREREREREICAWHKLSLLGDIFDKDTRNSSNTTSLDLYLVIILLSAENTVSYSYVVAKASSILAAI